MQTATFTQSLLDRYLEEEQAQQARQQSLAALNVHLDANDLAMLNMISKRFNKNRSDVAEELLAQALIDLFNRFDANERKLLARDADEAARILAQDIAEDNGLRDLSIKTGVWASHDRETSKLERKLARQQAELEQEQEAELESESEPQDNAQLDNPPTHSANEEQSATPPFDQAVGTFN